jgi:hypothetical protein
MNTKHMNTFYECGWNAKPGERNPYPQGSAEASRFDDGAADRMQDARNAARAVHGTLEVFQTVQSSPCFAKYIVTRIPAHSRDYCAYEVRRADHWPHVNCPCTVHLTQYTYDAGECTAHVDAYNAHADDQELQAIEGKYGC